MYEFNEDSNQILLTPKKWRHSEINYLIKQMDILENRLGIVKSMNNFILEQSLEEAKLILQQIIDEKEGVMNTPSNQFRRPYGSC